MKKSILAFSLLGLVAQYAIAQSEVKIYGIIDTGIAYERANGESRIYQETGFMRPSRFGIKGSEELGGQNKISFVLEQGFESNSGTNSQGDKYMFGREANLSYEGALGKFGMGRIGNFMSGMGSWDPWGPNSGPFATGWGIAASGSTMSDYLRMDNTFAWQSPKLSGWQFMLQYSLDVLNTDLSPNAKNTRFASGGMTYMKDGLNVLAFAGYRFNPMIDQKGYKDTQTYGFAINKDFEFIRPFLSIQYAKNSLSVGKKPLLVFKAVEKNSPNTKGIDGIASIIGIDAKALGGTFKLAAQFYKGKNKGTVIEEKLSRLILSMGQEWPLSKRTVFYAGTNWGESSRKNSTFKEKNNALQIFSGLLHRF